MENNIGKSIIINDCALENIEIVALFIYRCIYNIYHCSCIF